MASIKYEEQTRPEFSTEASRSLRVTVLDRLGIVLNGPCPNCRIEMEFFVPLKVLRSSGGDNRPPVVVYCTAIGDIFGQPPGRKGCGAYWHSNVSITR